jgi:hypothetical protein
MQLTDILVIGSGVAPFFPVPREGSGVYLPIHIFLFIIRLPFLVATTLIYFTACAWLPVGSLIKRGVLWAILAIPGIWWIDLQIDGVKRGYVDNTERDTPFQAS